MKNGPIKEYEFIEEEFFDIDKERRTARVKLAFDKPSSIFDVNYSAKMPVFSDDFNDWITYAFRMIPAKYTERKTQRAHVARGAFCFDNLSFTRIN